MSYIQVANFVKYTETDVASLIRKAGKNPAKIGTEFLPHVERFPNGKMNLHLVHNSLAEKVGGPDYMVELNKNPIYIWEKLQENLHAVGIADDKDITKRKLPISLIVDAETAAVCNETRLGPRIKKMPLNPVSDLGNYRDNPFESSHSQEHAMENFLR